jgi:hypothetical protein
VRSRGSRAVSWRTKGEYAILFAVARRPDLRNDQVMSAEELQQFRNRLARLSLDAVRHAYNTAYARCRMVNDRVPSARSIQELVQAWKQLWKVR